MLPSFFSYECESFCYVSTVDHKMCVFEERGNRICPVNIQGFARYPSSFDYRMNATGWMLCRGRYLLRSMLILACSLRKATANKIIG